VPSASDTTAHAVCMMALFLHLAAMIAECANAEEEVSRAVEFAKTA